MSDSQNIKDQVTHVMALQLTRQRQEKQATLRRHIFFLSFSFWLLVVSWGLLLARDFMHASEGTFSWENLPLILLMAISSGVVLSRKRTLTSELTRTQISVAT
jgi:hypothetical protein